MTEEAIMIELPGHMVRIRHSLIVRDVAGIAIGRRSIVRPALVALLTGERDVRALQYKSRAVMIEGGRLPSRSAVAMITNMAELSL